tara:strand:- start:313 stop:1122 length:810 start_codon:yes stop_codon:yes gene_type:complete
MNKIIKRPESIEIHQLTMKGVENFCEAIGLLRQYIDDQEKIYKVKQGNIDSKILEILKELPKINSGESKKFNNSPSIDLTLVHPTRFELSKYIFIRLNQFIDKNKLENNIGFWTWLALVYFEDLTDSFRNVSAEVNYIPEMGDIKLSNQKKKLYEHSIREGFIMYRSFRDESKVYFSKKGVGYMGDFWESTRGLGTIRRNDILHKFILKTYSDPNGSGFARVGSTSQKGKSWSLRRLANAYSNLSVNYAAPLLALEDLENLLGEDFIPE